MSTDASDNLRLSAGGSVDHGPYRPVTALIEEQADRTPDRPALVWRGARKERVLTYAEFDALANGLAARLSAAGAGPGSVVPVVVGNSVELPLCMVALMKTGAAFALCDPVWPEERLRSVLGTLDPPLVLTSGPPVCAGRPATVVRAAGITPSTERPGVLPGAGDIAYGVFTSGTTGAPKCALNLHGGLTNRFRFMTRHFRATGREVVLQNSRHTFDSAIWQLLWPLTTGGRTVVPEQGEFLDLERTVEAIDRHRVTVTDFVPAILGMLVALLESDPAAVRRVSSLRHLVVGGEEIVPHSVHRLREMVPGLEIDNGYGPSETAIGMVFHRVRGDEGDHIPLGRPIDNCHALVVDDALRPLPAGATGEILVGGACVGAGYLGDPERTERAFVPNPFPSVPGERLYRTGDLGWYDERGLLRFAGRRDRQAKVDGVRIEPAEIEAAAEGCRGVVQAKAMTVRRAGRTRLVVAAATEPGTTPAALRAHLASVLPRIQVPRHCFVLQSLPLTDNGKVDLRALRAIVEDKLESEARPAAHGPAGSQTPVQRIAYVMGSVLGLPDFRAGDDFLARGGDSLSAMSATLRIREAVGARVSLSDVYEHRTPERLAAALDGSGARGGEEPGAPAGDEARSMERDARLPADLTRLARRAADAVPAVPPRTVLVTGATGFVGARTVHRLVTSTGARAVCLVRARDDAHARERLARTLRSQGLWDADVAARVEARHGDLERPRFGWPRPQWESLTAECDAVLHIGGLVNFLLDYRSHRPANVAGTAEVLRFALSGRPKPLHHISTLGVLDRHAAGAAEPVGEDFDPRDAALPASGYSRSKWVAERMVLAARRLGAPVVVHRLGEVMPAADNGVPNPAALTHLLLSAFLQLGVRPGVPMVSDYTPVDETAARLVAALTEPPPGPPGRGVYHVFRPGGVDFAALDLAAPDGARTLRTVPAEEFAAALREAADGDRDSAAAVLHALLTALPSAAPGGPPDFRHLLSDNPGLFTRDACAALDARHGLREGPLEAAVAAYRATLTS
ncbi:non-ribosomal peptide synthetase [Streptomyces pini]|uniref:Amino acid adenylation domain-containing protein/thioester reductase domain-containing protein n=1 Tax=Streptomyces pini TaxID=1520580 RepID=A0A1I3XLD0_9ACTN|nr:non-ribosomal peptide synthetase [Streptomyces pini]SFK20374.1 amino acid adenylation domain-containing protein/thioester reductase domain-containing protein [Streptomyces pini]